MCPCSPRRSAPARLTRASSRSNLWRSSWARSRAVFDYLPVNDQRFQISLLPSPSSLYLIYRCACICCVVCCSMAKCLTAIRLTANQKTCVTSSSSTWPSSSTKRFSPSLSLSPSLPASLSPSLSFSAIGSCCGVNDQGCAHSHHHLARRTECRQLSQRS